MLLDSISIANQYGVTACTSDFYRVHVFSAIKLVRSEGGHLPTLTGAGVERVKFYGSPVNYHDRCKYLNICFRHNDVWWSAFHWPLLYLMPAAQLGCWWRYCHLLNWLPLNMLQPKDVGGRQTIHALIYERQWWYHADLTVWRRMGTALLNVLLPYDNNMWSLHRGDISLF